MRVTQSEIYRTFLANLETLNGNLNSTSRQVSSGKKISCLMDSPADSAEIAAINERAAEVDVYRSNMNTASFFLQSADSPLSEVNNLVTSIYTEGSQSASDSVSADSRAAIAAEIRSLRDQIFSLANTQERGRYLFAGSNVLSVPFAISGDAVSYNGNDVVNGITVDNGVKVSESIAGSTAFNSVFSAINGLLTAMDGNDVSNITTALGQFSSALSDLGLAREQIGSNLSALTNVATNLTSEKTSLTARKSKLEDADMAAATVQLGQDQNVLQAALSVGRNILSQRDLFDILG
jgi:flagellar hook-associated protein 3 FlgL